MRRIALAAVVPVLLGLLLAPAAGATFHLIKVREVYLGSALSPEAKYVELQMFASGQNLVKGHTVRTYDASGAVAGSSTLPADVANGDSQSTILIATQQAAEQFDLAPDAALDQPGKLLAGGGAACWEELDCVSWGNFKGSLPSPAGSPAAPGGIPDGGALRRSIVRGCGTNLSGSDDSDDSAADFLLDSPQPRPNSSPPLEQPCSSEAGGGALGPYPGGPSGAPQTILRRKPPKRTTDRTPSFRFGADEARVRFQCKLDKSAYRACRSPFTSKRLDLGAHVFKVRAVDSGGRADPSPASYRFRVIRKRG